MNPKTFEIYSATSSQISYPRNTMQEMLDELREAIKELFEKNLNKQQ
jgi:hypothetical protein